MRLHYYQNWDHTGIKVSFLLRSNGTWLWGFVLGEDQIKWENRLTCHRSVCFKINIHRWHNWLRGSRRFATRNLSQSNFPSIFQCSLKLEKKKILVLGKEVAFFFFLLRCLRCVYIIGPGGPDMVLWETVSATSVRSLAPTTYWVRVPFCFHMTNSANTSGFSLNLQKPQSVSSQIQMLK